MTNLKHALRDFWKDEEGASAIEYALLAALIAIVIAAGAIALGTNINSLFQKIADCLAKPKESCTF